MLIAIDTATRFASLALYEPDRVLAELTWQTKDNHTTELMPSLVDMMDRQGLDASHLSGVAVAIGPGSFTGLRIGLAVAKGLVMSLDLPLIGVPTLEILPYAVGDIDLPTWSVIQAGRGRLCWAKYLYHRDTWALQPSLEVGTISEFIERLDEPAVVCGELSQSERDVISTRFGKDLILVPPTFALRRAAFLADLAWRRLQRGERDDVVTLSPIYLHRPEGTEPA